ncbi:zinc-dependent metalloprotease [Pyxidicoccus sp. 3LFB2]
MFKRAAVLVVSCGAMLVGCGTEPQSESEEIVSNLIQAGFPSNDIMVVGDVVYLGRDAEVSLESSREMIEQGIGTGEQYRTSNLVSTSVTKICINPTSQFNGYSRLSEGLDLAIENYNSLGLSFTMVRGPATGCSASISARTTSGVGGSAGFPKGGKPYGTINIGVGLQDYSVDVNEHVITHELGHTIGFRHSDYYDRSISCGSGGNEGASNVGAIHIPGTPTTATRGGSVMNSCFSSNESGEWSSSDRTALNYLY